MENEKSAIEKFLSDTDSNVKFDTPESAFGEESKVEEEVVEEKPLPFHKDPKIQKFIEREISKRLEEIEPVRKAEVAEESEGDYDDVVDSFTQIIGNDTPEKVKALEALKKSLNGLDQRAVDKAQAKVEEIASREQNEYTEALEEAEEELENAFDNIREIHGIDLNSSRNDSLRTQFVNFVEKIAPKNSRGEVIDYPDMQSAWETFSEIRKGPTSRAKELASRSMSSSSSTIAQQPRKVDWQAVDEFMDTLK